ncbi:hypothetical protein O7632_01905 [Solwaraspora sp. WMMD406]|uniref:hypothetical protein n=1 Tax=Solwaraspora sp. WMMD406 TaxID=3016095 RepID=UPI00241809CE|nr:hypothetical protein [Solwaraspora sp. WMMD406]MDG4762875.1 hypothetical protein [Solwaraspora sp. WMMD406]
MGHPDASEIVGSGDVRATWPDDSDDGAFQAFVETTTSGLEVLPVGHPARPALAERLIQLVLSDRDANGMNRLRSLSRLRPLDRLVTLADERRSVSPQWRRTRAAARILALMCAVSERELLDPRTAAVELDQLIADHSEDPEVQTLAVSAQAMVRIASGTIQDLGALRESIANLGQLVAGNPEMVSMHRSLHECLNMLEAHQAGDTATALSLLADCIAKSGDLPEDNLLRRAFHEIAPMTAEFQAQTGVPDTDLAAHDLRMKGIQHRADHPDAPDAHRALLLVGKGGLALRGGAEQDPARIGAAIGDLREAVSLTPKDHPEHVFHLASLAMALSHRAQASGTLGDVDESVTILEQARVLARSPAHPDWSLVNGLLADLRSRRGEALPARLAALEGLRGYVWQVMLQPDPSAARAIARDAAARAMSTARRCLVDHALADALRAIDAGRGLMLFAATELRDPYTRLVDAGRADLAERWRATERPPAHVREDVLTVLSQDAGLLDPPDLGEIQDALRRAQMWMLDADREPPRHMPAPLRRTLADSDPAHVVAWAGFLHWGQ